MEDVLSSGCGGDTLSVSRWAEFNQGRSCFMGWFARADMRTPLTDAPAEPGTSCLTCVRTVSGDGHTSRGRLTSLTVPLLLRLQIRARHRRGEGNPLSTVSVPGVSSYVTDVNLEPTG